MKQFFRHVFGILAIILIVGTAFLYRWLSSSLPETGTDRVWAELAAPVSVATDSYGIPAINAENRIDAIRALGYLTARDRLFQMELMRRKSAGRLAEIFGAPALPIDTRSRTLGFRRVAKKIAEKLPAEHKSYLQAYVQGVNHFLAENNTLPFEFGILGFRPEPWKIEDSLSIALGMFDLLTGVAEQEERMLSVMAETLPKDVLAFLTPASDRYTDFLLKVQSSHTPIPAASLAKLLAMADAGNEIALSDGSVRFEAPMPGSNAWAVAAKRTADGRAILANDMHLGISVPAIWYRAQIEFPGNQAAGITLPGFPAMVAGSNRHVSWGETNLSGDFLDLVQLEIHPEDQDLYRYLGQWRRFDRIVENIKVKGGKTLTLAVRESLWGPVSQEPLLGRSVAVHWTALDADAFSMSLIDMETAKTIEQAVTIAHRSGGPPLNLLLADDHGHIAWTLSGLIPERRRHDGSISLSWADGSFGWTGYVSSGDIPVERDPANGFLVSANHRRFGPDVPYAIGRQFAGGYRAYRISEQLNRMSVIGEKDMLVMQLDTASGFYDYYQQLALSVLKPEILQNNPELAAVRDYVLAWQGKADRNSLGLPLLVEFRRQLAHSVFRPFLLPCRRVDQQFNYSWTLIDGPLQALLTAKPPNLLPDAKYYRSWDDFILGQLRIGVRRLEEKYPDKKLSALTWGLVNRSHFTHPFSSQLPWLGLLLDMPVNELPGCVECIRVATPGFGASERLVVSPNHWSDGILHVPGGQSGHPLSPHFRDQFAYWLKGLALPFEAGKPVSKMIMKPPRNQANEALKINDG